MTSCLRGGGTSVFAQDRFKPKYLRENNQAFRELTSYTPDNGWIEFKPDKAPAADSFFERFGTTIGLAQDYTMRPITDKTDTLRIRHQHYQLYYKNIPVETVEFSLHSKQNRPTVAHGRIVDNLNVDVSNPLTEQAARVFALVDQKLTEASFIDVTLSPERLTFAKTLRQFCRNVQRIPN